MTGAAQPGVTLGPELAEPIAAAFGLSHHSPSQRG